MNADEFLRLVWPATGLYCIATPYKTGYSHRVFETIDEAVTYVASITSSENIFFATHALREERIWNDQHHRDKDTKEWVAGWSVRTQSNMRASRILFFDLDVSPTDEKKYPSQAHAAMDLIRFTKETGLPKPMVTSSGNGLHVYWMLDRELDSATDWLMQAARLRQLATHYGLKFDPSRTTDSSSVLRVAGTFNVKASGRRAVEVKGKGVVTSVEDWDQCIQAALVGVQVAPATKKAAASLLPPGIVSNLQRTFDKPPPSMRSLLTVCAQARRLAQLKGCNPEPEWFWGDIGVVLYTEGGYENVHKISSGYPGYSRAETDAKIEQWKSKATGPTTCQQLEKVCAPADATLCHSCPHLAAHTSPIWIAHLHDTAPPVVVANPITQVEIEVPAPPMPYQRKRVGGIEMLMESKEGKQFTVPIYPYDLYPIERASNTMRETEQQLWRVHLPHGVIRDFTISASTFVDDRALQGRLANHGVYSSKFADLKAYMSAYIQELQKRSPVNDQSNHLGWNEDHTVFTMPDRAFHRDGTITNVSLGPVAVGTKEFINKKGSLQKQIGLLHFFSDLAYTPNRAYILASFAAPLFHMTGHTGSIINATGETGASKSTALYTAASIWGPPMKYTLNGTTDGATPLARNARRDVLANLPVCLDEITRIAADVAKNFAFNVTQPGSRIRLERDGTPKPEEHIDRSTLVLTSANISLHSLLAIDNAAGTAASVRVFEIMFNKNGVHLPYEADAFLRDINDNFGYLGEAFIQFVVVNYDLIKARVIKVVEELAKAGKMRQEERFWFSIAAAILVAGDIARSLRLISWDMKVIKDWLIDEQIPMMRGIVTEEAEAGAPLTILTDYLERINAQIIKTTHQHNGPRPNLIQDPRGEMLAHYDIGTQTMYVLRDGFRRACERRGAYAQHILKTLNKDGVVPLVETKRILGLNTSYAKTQSSCFTIDMSHPNLVGVQLPVIPPVAQAGVPHLRVV